MYVYICIYIISTIYPEQTEVAIEPDLDLEEIHPPAKNNSNKKRTSLRISLIRRVSENKTRKTNKKNLSFHKRFIII